MVFVQRSILKRVQIISKISTFLPNNLEKKGCDNKRGNFLQNNLTIDFNHEMI